MEESGNIFEKQIIYNGNAKVGKPPTRLQKYAPESLKLDQMRSSAAADTARTSPFGTSSTMTSEAAATPIPLLTPLALSPSPFPETSDEFVFLIPTDNDMKAETPVPTSTDHDMKAATPAQTSTAIFGWKQPVSTGFNAETSTFLALFQNTCVLVNDAQ